MVVMFRPSQLMSRCYLIRFSNAGIILFIFLTHLFSSAYAQTNQSASPLEQAEFEFAQWNRRVNELVKSSASNSSALSEPENSFYLALLARIIWKQNGFEAQTYLRKSADLVMNGLKTEDEKKLESNLGYAVPTLQIIFELDEKIGVEVVSKFEAGFEEAPSQTLRKNSKIASLFASIGFHVARINPKLALAYGSNSLKYGFAQELPGLIVEINLKDSLSAETLIKRAKVLATGNYTEASYLLAFNLNRYLGEFNKGRQFSNNSRRLVAELFSELLSGAVVIESERPRRCGIAFYAASVRPMIDEFLPEQSSRFRDNAQICLPFLPGSLRGTSKAKIDGGPDTVDELMKAARDSKDPEVKVMNYRAVFLKLQEANNHEMIISILEGFDGDEYREISPIGWGNWRVSAAASATLSAFESGDIPASFKFINETPKFLRPRVRKRFAANTLVLANREVHTENLAEMQKELDSLEIPVQEVACLYLDLANMYLPITPSESHIVFRNAIKAINKADGNNPDFDPDKDWASREDYIVLDSQFLETDEQNVLLAINEISSRRSRLRISLGLLETSLKSLDNAKVKLETIKRTAKKMP